MSRSHLLKATRRTAAVLITAAVAFALTFALVRPTGPDTPPAQTTTAPAFTIPERVATIQNLERVATIKPMRTIAGSLEDTQTVPPAP
jgi:hypothetical protein